MYCISDAQIDFILDDISARGIGMVSLQQDLLDHICCIIEQNLEEGDDFERFYQQTVSTFYQSELKEIETETIHLLIHKNYYIMKKILLISGGVSSAVLFLGLLFKFMHWPGAAVMLVFGVTILSLVFLPLMFTLKIKEEKHIKDKVIIGIGTFSAILISLGILFKVMHWPGANAMVSSAFLILVLLFLPIYFFAGIRNPETKVNTVVSSVLIFAGCGLLLTLMRSPAGNRKEYAIETNHFLRNEQIVKTEARQIGMLSQAPIDPELAKEGEQIAQLCGELKAFLLKSETGFESIDNDFDSKDAYISDTYVHDYLGHSKDAMQKLGNLKNLIIAYNQRAGSKVQSIPQKAPFLETDGRVKTALNDLIQIQMVVLQNQRELLASR